MFSIKPDKAITVRKEISRQAAERFDEKFE